MDNKGVCAQSIIPVIACPAGKFYDPTEGCLSCPQGCSECKNANTCTKCSGDGLVPNGNQCVAQCGDGKVLPGEQCDDGNTKSADGCSNTCTVENGYRCGGIPSVCTPNGPVCGDGVISQPEKCDDKNKNNNDGCNQMCEVEKGYTCAGAPSICSKGGSGQSSYGMSLNSPVIINYSNIFTMIRVDHSF